MPLSSAQVADRERSLARAARLLAKRPMDAAEVADHLSVTKATAYAWIKILLGRGQVRLAGTVRGVSGSWAKVYGPPIKKNGGKNAKAKP